MYFLCREIIYIKIRFIFRIKEKTKYIVQPFNEKPIP